MIVFILFLSSQAETNGLSSFSWLKKSVGVMMLVEPGEEGESRLTRTSFSCDDIANSSAYVLCIAGAYELTTMQEGACKGCNLQKKEHLVLPDDDIPRLCLSLS